MPPESSTENLGQGQCPYDPRELSGAPIGMLHCPECGCMVVAGMHHPQCFIGDCDYGTVLDDPQTGEAPDG